MHSPQINNLLAAVSEKYGGFEYYGSSASEEHSTCFKLKGILATFSVHTQDGALSAAYDVQIEGVPPGDYLYACVVSLSELMELISKYEQTAARWP